MIKVRGLYDGQNIKLLEKVNFPKMVEVEVSLQPIKKKESSLKRQLKTMKKGFDMGKILVHSREELYER